mmetsp:Transcript_22451/g.54331  ORF Transcript_22451/g.54331 Transcript_22451/m.54331 type:complete len:235 (+) Transcript_22451:1437-2141(+)
MLLRVPRRVPWGRGVLQPGGLQEGSYHTENAQAHHCALSGSVRRNSISHSQSRADDFAHGSATDGISRADAHLQPDYQPHRIAHYSFSDQPADLCSLRGRAVPKCGALPVQSGLLRSWVELLQRKECMDGELRHPHGTADLGGAHDRVAFTYSFRQYCADKSSDGSADGDSDQAGGRGVLFEHLCSHRQYADRAYREAVPSGLTPRLRHEQRRKANTHINPYVRKRRQSILRRR